MTDFGAPALITLLPPEDLALIRAAASRCSYRDGDLVHDRGDDNLGMGLVVRGRVKLVTPLRDGRETFVSFINPGQNYGDITLRGAGRGTGQATGGGGQGTGRRSHRAIAIGETEIDHVPPAAFARLCERPAIVRALYEVTAARLAVAIDLLDDMRSLSPEVRLAKLLALMSGAQAEPAVVEFLQEDFANLLGVSGVTLAKALKGLKQADLIETGYRQITIRDPAALRAWLAIRVPD